MILKINAVNQGWVFYDEISKIRVFSAEWKEQPPEEEGQPTPIDFTRGGGEERYQPDHIWVDFQGSVSMEEGKPVSPKHGYCSIASCVLTNGNHKYIAFSTAYLLSNDGKTIEKL